jgi:hypothetical protein
MTQEQLIFLLLTLTVQACIDETLPFEAELKALLTFLVKSHAIHGVHPSFRRGALSDWVDRLRQGIQVASEFLVPPRKRRPVNSTSKSISPDSPLSTLSSSFMALMMDDLDTPEETPFILKSKPKLPCYTAERVNGHSYNRIIGLLEYSVRWVGSAEEETMESYPNLRHLHVLNEYETRMPNIDPSKGLGDRKCIQQRIARSLGKHIFLGTGKLLQCSWRKTRILMYLSWGRNGS